MKFYKLSTFVVALLIIGNPSAQVNTNQNLMLADKTDDTLQSLRAEKYNTDNKQTKDFRDYQKAPDHVKAFYKAQHTHQTLQFAQEKRDHYSKLNQGAYGIWETLELLSKLVDESDPDLNLPQIQHALQTAEAIRKDGHPDWLILAGLIHDHGKMLAVWGEPQWAVVGDTYPLGCQFSSKIIFHEYFKNNPDSTNPKYNSSLGIYKHHTGLKNVVMAWGHDEYLYHVLKNQSTLPPEALFVIRYHSFYPLHKEGDYEYLLDDEDKKLLPWLKTFNQYDLYSKSSKSLNVAELKPYYEQLIQKYFPQKTIQW